MQSTDPDRLTFFARAEFHNKVQLVGIRQADRFAHMYVLGKTGTGKSTLLETLLRLDILEGGGLMLLDPHGDLAERVMDAVPEDRRDDVVYFDVPDASRPMGLNPMDVPPGASRSLAVSNLLEIFRKLWTDSWGPRLEHVLRNAFLALMDQPEATLADVLRLIGDKDFRRKAAEETGNGQVRAFWLDEFARYSPAFRAVIVAPIQNKVGAFLADPLLNAIVTRRSAFDLREVMDSGKILLVNLAKGRIGEDAAALLGALLMTKAGLAGLSRADAPEESRRPFFVYADEFQTFTTLGTAGMLSELRKYRVGMVLAHQYVSQLDPAVRDAVLGNAGTMVSFRLGAADAHTIAKEFHPEVRAMDLVSLPNYHVYLKVMAHGMVSRPFSAETIRLRHV
ncbi:MAG TPA: type IV secretion system DNA-binding domain-containing protein [Pyrinomonadaceae bacterium]